MAIGVSAAAHAAVPSTISIGYNQATETFHGMVRSSDAECEGGRTVKVYLQTPNGPELQGTVTANANGGWKLEVMHAQGHYVAKAPKDKVMHTTCGKAKSRTVDVM